MFADPQSVTVNAVAQSLAAVGRGDSKSVYKKDDQSYTLTLQNTDSKSGSARRRITARLDHQKVAANPLNPSSNMPFSMSAYLVIDQPAVGYTNSELKDIAAGLLAWLSASSYANVTKLLGGET